MTTLSLRLPDSLHNQLRDLAKREGISINQFLASAAAEKLAALETEAYLSERTRRGRKTKFKAVLKKIPRVAPVAGDEIEAQGRGRNF